MVTLSKIYTRTGDAGTTRLSDNSEVPKTDPRVEAYGHVDEANSAVGVAVALGGLPERVVEMLALVRNELFDVGADLSTPLREQYDYEPLRVKAEWVEELERDCDVYLERVEPLRSFILPGGSVAAAHLHLALTVVRRAERSAWAAVEAYGTDPSPDKGTGGVNPLTATYLNRLSDLLFILARVANIGRQGSEEQGDVLWRPGGGRAAAPSSRGRGPSTTAEDG